MVHGECNAEVAALRLPFGLPFGREHFGVARALLNRSPLRLKDILRTLLVFLVLCKHQHPLSRSSRDVRNQRTTANGSARLGWPPKDSGEASLCSTLRFLIDSNNEVSIGHHMFIYLASDTDSLSDDVAAILEDHLSALEGMGTRILQM